MTNRNNKTKEREREREKKKDLSKKIIKKDEESHCS